MSHKKSSRKEIDMRGFIGKRIENGEMDLEELRRICFDFMLPIYTNTFFSILGGTIGLLTALILVLFTKLEIISNLIADAFLKTAVLGLTLLGGFLLSAGIGIFLGRFIGKRFVEPQIDKSLGNPIDIIEFYYEMKRLFRKKEKNKK